MMEDTALSDHHQGQRFPGKSYQRTPTPSGQNYAKKQDIYIVPKYLVSRTPILARYRRGN